MLTGVGCNKCRNAEICNIKERIEFSVGLIDDYLKGINLPHQINTELSCSLWILDDTRTEYNHYWEE